MWLGVGNMACWLSEGEEREKRKDPCGRACVSEVGVCKMGIGMFMWACTPICGVFFPFFLDSGCVQIN